MPDFNPAVQQTPDYPYINWSREIQEPRPDTSKEVLLKGSAEALGAGVQNVDESIKKGIQTDIYSQVDPVRDQFMNNLHTADQTIRGGVNLVSPTTGAAQPSDVKALPNQLELLNNARSNGKISQTDYDARLNALAKDIRSKYPGYREYVDETFHRATGRDSANEYIRQVIGDINSFEDQRRGAKDKVLDKVMSTGMKFPGAAMIVRNIQSGKPGADAMALQWLNDNESADHTLEMGIKRREALAGIQKLGQEDARDSAKTDATSSNSTVINSSFDALFAASGFSDKDQLQAALNSIRRGQTPDATQEQLSQMSVFLNQSRGALKSQLAINLTNHYNSASKRSTVDDLGGSAEAEKQIEADLKLYYDPIADALGKGQWALATSQKQIIDGKIRDKAGAMFSDKDVKDSLLLTAAIHQMDPQMGSFMSAAQANLPPVLQAKYGVDAAKTVGTPNGAAPLKTTLETAKAKNINDGKYYKQMIDLFSKIGDKHITDETRDKLIENAFSDQNKGMLAMFAKGSGTVVRSGRVVQPPMGSQDYVFSQLTSPDMIREVAKRSKEHPEYWTNFRNWAENDIRFVFDQDLLHADSTKYAQNAIKYDNTTGNFKEVLKPVHGRIPPKSELDKPLAAVSKHLKAMHDIYAQEGVDPSAGLYTLMNTLGAEPSSVVGRMIKALEVSHQ